MFVEKQGQKSESAQSRFTSIEPREQRPTWWDWEASNIGQVTLGSSYRLKVWEVACDNLTRPQFVSPECLDPWNSRNSDRKASHFLCFRAPKMTTGEQGMSASMLAGFHFRFQNSARNRCTYWMIKRRRKLTGRWLNSVEWRYFRG